MTWRAAITAAAVYSALTIVFTFPLILQLSSVVPHDLGDPLLSTAILWWNAHVLPFTEKWWNGFAFYPAPGFMAMSDHRLGESLIAGPLQWIGFSPVAAYNLTLLATFPLSAIAAHWLGFVLTRRHDAAAICGLAYAFAPYRVAHIQHLELLGGFGMPLALVGLHQYLNTRKLRWAALFSGGLVLQGLLASYYLLFFSVLLGLWIIWFVRWSEWRQLMVIGAAAAAAFVALLPIAVGYRRIHAYYGFERSLNEIVSLSADVSGLYATSPLLLLWGWMSGWARPEGELFPGLTIAALAVVGAGAAWRSRVAGPDRWSRLRSFLLPLAAAAATVAACGWLFAPWHLNVPGLSMSSDTPFKPFTVAAWIMAIWFLSSPRVRHTYRARSMFAFYLLATAALVLCSLGPKPTWYGHQFLYEPPYAWLMRLPLFGGVRVPARFAMPAMLALCASGALAFNRLQLHHRRRAILALLLMAGILADGWMRNLPLPAVPAMWPAERAEGFSAVLELPLGTVSDDLRAVYRATGHRHPLVNGNSGFSPPHYFSLRTAFEERDPAALDGLPPSGDVLIVVEKMHDRDGSWDAFLSAHPRVTRLSSDDRWTFFAAEPPPAQPVCSGEPLPIASITQNGAALDLEPLRDGDPTTIWVPPVPQRADESLVLDLGRQAQPCATLLSVGGYGRSYPRRLVVETSIDGINWRVVAATRTAGLTMRAALTDPKLAPIPVSLRPSTARFIKLRLDESHSEVPWLVADVVVLGGEP